MYLSSLRMMAVILCYLVAQVKTYPIQGWPIYPQTPKEYTDDEYYYAPKIQYYYDAPAMSMPETYGQVQYPYFYDPYGQFASNEAPKRQEERLAALPIGQETWFENDNTPRWRSNDVDDVSAAFLDNLILTQMAEDAQRRRENTRAAFPPVDYDEQDVEDEDVRELKALSTNPHYHAPKTVPRIEDEDYASEDGFINWNGNKRGFTTAAPTINSAAPEIGEEEKVLLRPTRTPNSHQHHRAENKKNDALLYNTIAKLLAKNSQTSETQESTKARRIDKRFVAGDSDLVVELRGLKHGIVT